MRKIIPFTKDLTFINDIYEITSISLEHNYIASENEIKGEFIINGDYTKSIIDEKEPFIFKFKPVSIGLTSCVDIANEV